MDILPIESMPNLSKRLGKAGCDRIRAGQLTRNSQTSRSLKNTVKLQMQGFQPGHPGDLSDILTGAARSQSDGDKSLNIERLYVLFQCLEYIDTKAVMKITQLAERQARRYVAACRLALPYLEKYFRKDIDYDQWLSDPYTTGAS